MKLVLPSLLACLIASTSGASSSLMALAILTLMFTPELAPMGLSLPLELSGLFKDQIASSLIFLSLVITCLMLITFQAAPHHKTSMELLSLVLLLVLILTFSSASLISFYFLFEISLIPISLMVFGWGYQPERIPAGVAMMLYTMIASLPLLFMIISLQLSSYTDFSSPPSFCLSHSFSWLPAFCLILGFLVKFPMYSFHLWLPKAHVEAPVLGSMVLAALLLKLGGFGLWRISSVMPVNTPYVALQAFSLMGGALVSLLCLSQTDLKVLIAYSSVAHMSLAISVLLMMTPKSSYSSFLMMIAHGVSSSAMFAGANYIYLMSHSRSMLMAGGMLVMAPAMSLLWFLCCAGNMAAPPSINLVAEVWCIGSILSADSSLAFWVGLISFLAAAYSLILYASPTQGQLLSSNNQSYWAGMKSYSVLAPHCVMLLVMMFLFL